MLPEDRGTKIELYERPPRVRAHSADTAAPGCYACGRSLLMSTDSGLYLGLASRHSAPSNYLETLRVLVDGGWTSNDHGQLSYLPLGDGDNFAWRGLPLEREPEMWTELGLKAAAGELLGLTLRWQETPIGASFLVAPDLNITISFLINRRVTARGVTDVTWYLERLVPLLGAHWDITSLQWNEHP